MNKTPIDWVKNPDGTQGYTWNPITGCLNGCEYCYARKLANGRLKQRYLANDNTIMRFKDGYAPMKLKVTDPFYPRFWWDRLVEPTDNQQPRGIFTCDMSDLFGIGIPHLWTEMVMLQIKRCPQHRFYLLTKQPQNLIKWSPFPDNCFVGVTVTTRLQAHNAFNHLQSVEARVKYISFEPLLDDVSQYLYFPNLIKAVNWVIIGAQTKPYKPPKIEWVEEIVQAADQAGIPVFLKDNLMVEHDKALAQGLWNLERRQEMPK